MNNEIVAMLPDERDLPKWFTRKLRSDLELAFEDGKYIGNGEVLLAVRGTAFDADGFTAERLFAMKTVSELDERQQVHIAQVEPVFRRLLRVSSYAVRTTDGNLVALRYVGLLQSFYPTAKWFSAGPGEALVAKLNNQIVAVVMPLQEIA